MKPEKLLRDISKRYPGCWKTATDIITDAPMDWPDWCFMPVAGWYAIVSNALGVDSISKLEDIQDVAVMAATGACGSGKTRIRSTRTFMMLLYQPGLTTRSHTMFFSGFRHGVFMFR